MSQIARIPPGGRRELGLINWAISRIAARKVRAPHMHLFETLAFGGPLDEEQRRYSTWDEAMAGHLVLVGMVSAALGEEGVEG